MECATSTASEEGRGGGGNDNSEVGVDSEGRMDARTDADKNESGSADEGAETEGEARGGNLGNCETMEDADVLALGGAGGRRTAVWTKNEALPPVHGILRLGA